MDIDFHAIKHSDGTYTIVVTFSNVPDAEQASRAKNLLKRALLESGAIGSTTPLPWQP